MWRRARSRPAGPAPECNTRGSLSWGSPLWSQQVGDMWRICVCAAVIRPSRAWSTSDGALKRSQEGWIWKPVVLRRVLLEARTAAHKTLHISHKSHLMELWRWSYRCTVWSTKKANLMKKCCCPNPTPVYRHRSWHWWHWVPVTWSALADVKCTVNMSKCRGCAGTLTCFVSREALSSDFQTQFHQDWQNDRVFFWFLIIYFRLTYTFFFFFFNSESYYGASLANVSICFEDTDKSIIPLHSHTTVITFLAIASENPYHKVSELYLVKFKRLGQTKSLPQILTCHQHHESCFKQRGALHAEDHTHFLSYTDLILLTNKYIPTARGVCPTSPLTFHCGCLLPSAQRQS